MLEALFGLCRKLAENEPLKIFMALSDVDRDRAKPLETATVDRLAREYRDMDAQYPLFAEAPAVERQNHSCLHGLRRTPIMQIRDPALRADAAGTLQALAGLWQIFVRQGTIRARPKRIRRWPR